jgi:hypothetical protein
MAEWFIRIASESPIWSPFKWGVCTRNGDKLKTEDESSAQNEGPTSDEWNAKIGKQMLQLLGVAGDGA